VERIAALVHALPPPGTAVDVANTPGGSQAVAWLSAHGRPARLVSAPPEPQATRLWEPSPGLPLALPAGRALDLGCGTGRDAVALALAGWHVTAIDHLSDALDRACSLADLHGVSLTLLALDVDKETLPEGPFDLVTAFRYLPSLPKMAGVLAPGGSLVVETFTDRERSRTGKPRDAALVLPAAGPPPLPDGLRLCDYAVREIGGRELARLWAEGPGPLPRAL